LTVTVPVNRSCGFRVVATLLQLPSPCREEASDVNSTQGRINAIRSAFVKR
jgi:hypothetical protein